MREAPSGGYRRRYNPAGEDRRRLEVAVPGGAARGFPGIGVMPDAGELSEAQRALIEAYAAGALSSEARREAQRLLETSEACRAHFRQLTAGRYPRLPNYTIIEQVGKGGFGVVYRAVHHAKERTEALKVLFSKTPLLTSFFENEVHLIARLRHPNIATLHEAQLSSPPLYYTMGFVEGQRLNEYIRSHKVSLGGRIELIRIVAEALDYAHSQGVVHRDIKPQNILVDDHGQPHIVDFGISTRFGISAGESAASDVRQEAPVGTLGYIAPEQRGGRDVDARADIYSLGAVLFNCITGEPARHAGDRERTVKLLRDLKVGRPEDLAAIIAKCVHPEPAQRYRTCRELIDDLDRYVAGRGVRARREPSLLRRLARLWAYVLRHYPGRVRVAATLALALTLPAMAERLRARVVVGIAHADRTVLIAFTPQTRQAIAEGRIGADLPGLDLNQPKSLRLLHGALLRRLLDARPMVVAWDYYFPDCWPQYDGPFVDAARSAPFPIVIGAIEFDVNVEPVVCESIAAAVHSVATLFNAKPRGSYREYEFVVCVQRGFNLPIPSLSLAAYAAASHPQCRPELQLDRERRRLHVRYRRIEPLAGQPRYLSTADTILLRTVQSANVGTHYEIEGQAGRLHENDSIAQARVEVRLADYWAPRTLPYEQVLTASTAELHKWFDGRAVVIGEMLPGRDEYVIAGDYSVHGCQVHAEALDALLGRYFQSRLSYREIATRTLLWAALGAVLGRLVAGRSWMLHWSFGPLCWTASLAILLTSLGAVYRYASTWVVEAAVGAAALLPAILLNLWITALRERELRFVPAAVSLEVDGTTLPSTVLAELDATSAAPGA